MARKKKETGDKDIVVKVFRAGSKGVEVALNGGERTVDEALEAAGMNLKASEVVQLNGEELDEDELEEVELEDGDRIVLVKNIEGGR